MGLIFVYQEQRGDFLNMNIGVGDFIKPDDEEYIYRIEGISETSLGTILMGESIAFGHGRWFCLKDTNFRKATQEEIELEISRAPKSFSFWIANKKGKIISNGRIYASSLERARELFVQKYEKLINFDHVGEYNIVETPLCLQKE